jgi:hypothetical protein
MNFQVRLAQERRNRLRLLSRWGDRASRAYCDGIPPPATRSTCASPLHLPSPQLTDSEEFIDGQFAGKLGEILIRCNNVLYVRGA